MSCRQEVDRQLSCHQSKEIQKADGGQDRNPRSARVSDQAFKLPWLVVLKSGCVFVPALMASEPKHALDVGGPEFDNSLSRGQPYPITSLASGAFCDRSGPLRIRRSKLRPAGHRARLFLCACRTIGLSCHARCFPTQRYGMALPRDGWSADCRSGYFRNNPIASRLLVYRERPAGCDKEWEQTHDAPR